MDERRGLRDENHPPPTVQGLDKRIAPDLHSTARISMPVADPPIVAHHARDVHRHDAHDLNFTSISPYIVKTMELVSLKQLFKRLSTGGRLLGLDVGSRNIGLAVSDPRCRVASPHSVMYRSNTTTLKNISRLESLVEELNIKGLVIGYPLELTGFQGKQGAQVKLFAKELQLSGRFPNLAYLYWDERLTSVAVTNVIGSMDITGRRRKNIIDKMSALCILQGCLDSLSRLENGTHGFASPQM